MKLIKDKLIDRGGPRRRPIGNKMGVWRKKKNKLIFTVFLFLFYQTKIIDLSLSMICLMINRGASTNSPRICGFHGKKLFIFSSRALQSAGVTIILPNVTSKKIFTRPIPARLRSILVLLVFHCSIMIILIYFVETVARCKRVYNKSL